ncbi:Trk system potassium uptake protein TrkG [Alteracholeplasma palmae J233]|uniref:Trk system potassium uptake protein TrkG n=2 Tax=Acholeplasma palmae TaxID=38986 RepID=U4KLD0_ALTPJ|nr:Trk system potassium uptake protein TrkG [Alteracholeplasma palmae J233]
MITLSFFVIIMIGTILLLLPISKTGKGSLDFIDAFFVSTSAITITGLSPVSDLSIILSPFGKVVLAVLIQIGGLSVLTISVFIMYIIGAKIGISNRVLIKENLNQNDLSGMVSLVVRIVTFTLCIEFTGFIINLFVFIPQYDTVTAIGISAFHAISAFNNAGFDLLGSISLQNYQAHILLNINTAALIMLGGIGFIVINDLIEKKSYKKLTTHSKIVLKVNLLLWILGMLVFKFSNLGGKSFSWLESFFLSVTARTAGFTTIDISAISAVATLMLIILMFIGASPSSTGGGIKTTTIYTIFKGIPSYAKGKQVITYQRLINNETRHKASTLLAVSLLIIISSTFVVLTFDHVNLEKAVFEIVSAFSNTGLSKNLTPTLSDYSKLTLCILMFIGRLGPLTILSLFNSEWHKKELHNIEYIEEKMMIG